MNMQFLGQNLFLTCADGMRDVAAGEVGGAAPDELREGRGGGRRGVGGGGVVTGGQIVVEVVGLG